MLNYRSELNNFALELKLQINPKIVFRKCDNIYFDTPQRLVLNQP